MGRGGGGGRGACRFAIAKVDLKPNFKMHLEDWSISVNEVFKLWSRIKADLKRGKTSNFYVK